MGKLLAASVGFFSLMPGVAIVTVGGVGVQPVIVMLLLYAGLLPFLNAKLPIQSLIWVLLTLISYAVSTVFSASSSFSIPYAAMQGIYLMLGAMGFSAILNVPDQRQEFARGYVTGALLSSVVAFFQLLYTIAGGGAISFANNANFSIVAAYDRGAAFTPESSALAALLIPAALGCWFERQAGGGLLAPWQRSWAALTVLGLGLASTKSSSLMYFPILFLLVSAFQSRRFPEFLSSVGKVLIPIAIAGLVFIPLYSTRIASTDADLSMAWRLTKILAGIDIFAANPVIGAGVGLVSDSDYFEPYLDIPPNLGWNTDPRKGVDSTAIRVLAETGLIGFAAFYFPILVFFRHARRLSRSPEFRVIATMSLGLLFSQFFISGYRDQVIFLLPAVLFAIAGGVRVSAIGSRFEHKPAMAGGGLLLSPSIRQRSP